MIILSWNCQWIGHPTAIPFLCDLVRTRKPNVILLCETISHSNNIEEIRVCLHYDCSFAVNCVGRSGGLCTMWKSSSLCNIVSYSDNHINTIINVRTYCSILMKVPKHV